MIHVPKIYVDVCILVACGMVLALVPCPMLKIGACSFAIGYLVFGLILPITRRNWVGTAIQVQAIMIWVLILLQIMHIITFREFALGLAIVSLLHLLVISTGALRLRKINKKEVVKSQRGNSNPS